MWREILTQVSRRRKTKENEGRVLSTRRSFSVLFPFFLCLVSKRLLTSTIQKTDRQIKRVNVDTETESREQDRWRRDGEEKSKGV